MVGDQREELGIYCYMVGACAAAGVMVGVDAFRVTSCPAGQNRQAVGLARLDEEAACPVHRPILAAAQLRTHRRGWGAGEILQVGNAGIEVATQHHMAIA